MMINRRNVLMSAPPAVVAGTGLGALTTCSSSGIQIDPNVIVEINKIVANTCNFIPAITTVITVVNALFPQVNGATSVAEGVIQQIASLLCKSAPMSGKLGASLDANGTQVPVHGWVVQDGKLIYV